MDANSLDKVKGVVDEVAKEFKENKLYIPVNRRPLTADATGVSNRPNIIRSSRVKANRVIGKKIELILPKEVNKGNPSKGKAQKRAYVRLPIYCPLAGFAVVQMVINKAVSGDEDIRSFLGPSGTIEYEVPPYSELANVKKMLAQSQEETQSGSRGAGQGQ